MATTDAKRRPYLLAHMTRNVAAGSAPAVLWKDLVTASGDTDDPCGAMVTDVANLVVLHNFDGLPWLTAFPLISGTGVSTNVLVGNFFGFFPFGSQDTKHRMIPSDVSTNFDNSVVGSVFNTAGSDGTTANTAPGLWVPLRELNTTAPAAVTFDNTVCVDKDDTTASAKRQRSLTPREIYVGGATQIVFLPSTPLNNTVAAGFSLMVGILHS